MDALIQKYVKYSGAHREYIQQGDHRRANRAYKHLTILYRAMEKDLEMAETAFSTLFNESSCAVRLWAAAHALGLNIRTEAAENILREIAQHDKKTLIGLSAEMTLKEWKKNGRLVF